MERKLLMRVHTNDISKLPILSKFACTMYYETNDKPHIIITTQRSKFFNEGPLTNESDLKILPKDSQSPQDINNAVQEVVQFEDRKNRFYYNNLINTTEIAQLLEQLQHERILPFNFPHATYLCNKYPTKKFENIFYDVFLTEYTEYCMAQTDQMHPKFKHCISQSIKHLYDEHTPAKLVEEFSTSLSDWYNYLLTSNCQNIVKSFGPVKVLLYALSMFSDYTKNDYTECYVSLNTETINKMVEGQIYYCQSFLSATTNFDCLPNTNCYAKISMTSQLYELSKFMQEMDDLGFVFDGQAECSFAVNISERSKRPEEGEIVFPLYYPFRVKSIEKEDGVTVVKLIAPSILLFDDEMAQIFENYLKNPTSTKDEEKIKKLIYSTFEMATLKDGKQKSESNKREVSVILVGSPSKFPKTGEEGDEL